MDHFPGNSVRIDRCGGGSLCKIQRSALSLDIGKEYPDAVWYVEDQQYYGNSYSHDHFPYMAEYQRYRYREDCSELLFINKSDCPVRIYCHRIYCHPQSSFL